MVGLRQIPRTATFAWSPSTSSTSLATGTRAGAVDEGFSNDTQLELWDLELDDDKRSHELQPIAKIDTDSRFHDIAWAPESDDHSQGMIAGALENGALDLWDVEKLRSGGGDALISRTSHHVGAIKALQFNPFRPELMATSGAKGELFMSDLNNVDKPFRIGNAVARGGDFDCLDWNKKVSHILATGSSEGFVTVWDVKTKKESLTLNNYSRKPASAVAWDPEKNTRLVTAVPSDTDPLILVWDLRNANAPERIIRGHDGGVLSLSWCPQDTDLLLSCGKDNRTICWNPNAKKPHSEYYGDFPVVTNWTFQTRWNPRNPNLLATASFDGKITVQSIQNTGFDVHQSTGNKALPIDDEDFFSKAQTQPPAASFSLMKAPKWLERPCGATFGFGGKIVSFKNSKTAGDKQGDKSQTGQGLLRISTFFVDSGVGTSTEAFEKSLKQNDLSRICEDRLSEAKTAAEKADWEVIKTLTAENPRKALVDHLGFATSEDEAADGISKLTINGDRTNETKSSDSSMPKSNRLSAFFENTGENDGFLSDLAATKGAKTNNPFQIYSGTESEPDRRITRALLLGQFEKALDVCLQEDRMSDAFMIAICGGSLCIEKARKAYFNTRLEGPSYLRLLASVVGKNLWDIVYNANLENWKELMATLCTYADAEEFPDLCEALGDRIEEQMNDGESSSEARKDAVFCYLAGSKLEKAVALWIAQMQEEQSGFQEMSGSSSFSAHARLLQNLIEKVTIFREVTHFEDNGRLATSGWKLEPLYDLYAEYADIVASQGQLQTAERYLDLLPDKYPAAEVAKNRVKQATKKAAPQQTMKQPAPTARTGSRNQPSVTDFQRQQMSSQMRQSATTNQYVQAHSNQNQNSYAPGVNGRYGGPGYPEQTAYQPDQTQQRPRMAPPSMYSTSASNQGTVPPSRNLNSSPSIPPPSKAATMSNWNDLPEDFIKPLATSRRGTPSVGAAVPSQYAPAPGPTYGGQPKATPPLPPPPKGFGGPPRTSSPATSTSQSSQPSERPPSAANVYAPEKPTQAPNQFQRPAPLPRGASPYNAPPSAPPPSNRYAPAPAAPSGQPEPSHLLTRDGQGLPSSNPYAPQQPYQTQQQQSSQAPGQVMQQLPTLLQGQSVSPQVSSQGPTQSAAPNNAQSHRERPTSRAPKHPPGDRSHIPANALPVYEILNADFQRVKARAPPTFKAHVNDAEKRLNILFDHLNNEDLLKRDTIESMLELAHALQARDYEQAQTIHIDILTNKTDECGNWMV
ncbi:MAG: hypothetical protein Q9195_000687 [Heterodermia aff. obscurata]